MNRTYKIFILSLLLVIGLYLGYVFGAPFEVLRSEINFVGPTNGSYAINSSNLSVAVVNLSANNYTLNFTGYINGTNSTYQVELLMQLGAVNGSRAPNNGTGGAGAQNNESVWGLGIITTFGNGSILVNGSNFSIATNRSIPDGNHSFYFNVSNKVNGTSSSNMSSQNFTIVIDTSRPLVFFSNETEGNNSNLTTRSNIFVNVSFNESNVANITFILANGTASSGNTTPSFNKTVFVSGSWSTTAEYNRSKWVNYTDLADANYSFNVSVTDVFNNINKSANLYRFITIDTHTPTITISASPTDALLSDVITLVCTATDNLDAGPVMSLEIKTPNAASYSTLSSTAQTAYKYQSATESGTYTVRCSATDYEGNLAQKTTTFVVAGEAEAAAGGGAGGGGGSAGGGGGAEEEVTPTEEVVTEEVPVSIEKTQTWAIEGAAKYTDVAIGAMYTFAFVGAQGEPTNHTIDVKEISEEQGYVLFVVESNAQDITVLEGEGKEIDLDGDGFSDLQITVDSIHGSFADLSFAKVGTWKELPQEEKGISVWVLVMVLAAVVLGIGAAVYWYFKK